MLNTKGTRIALIAFHEGGAAAHSNRPGAALFSEKIARDSIRGIRKQADIVVLSMHFGFDYFKCPSPYHVSLCRRLVDAGADLVLGHHPHVPQGVERYKNGLIAYSLGNFASWFADSSPKQPSDGFILRVNIKKSGIVDFELLPYVLDPDLVLRILRGVQGSDKLAEYAALSETLADPSRLRDEWYDHLRNFYFGYTAYYWKFCFRNGNAFQFLGRVSNLFKPTQANLIMLKSLLKYLLTGFALRAEARRFVRKVIKNSL
jgi:poly-gamma-glutamate synthesis protein (capsule biosynthesis protein)